MATSSQFVPAAKSELDFFRPRLLQTSQTGYETIPLKPINLVSTSSKRLEFFHPGKGSDFFRNLAKTYLYLRLKISKTTDGKEWDTTKNTYSFINYIGQAIISSIEVALNGTTITRNTDNFAYRVYMETLVTGDPTDASSHLPLGGFYLDTSNDISTGDFANNQGMKTRALLVARSAETEVISRLHGDVFNLNLYLPQGLDLAINLNLNSDAFVLMSNAEMAEPVQVELLDATLYTEICHINPAVLNAQARIFQDNNAIFPMQHVEVHTASVAAGLKAISLDNVFNGRLPSVLLIGLVDNTAYAGTVTENPLAFKHNDVVDLTVYVNGVAHRIGPMDFSKYKYAKAYHSLLCATGLFARGEPAMITYSMYPKGFTLFGFDFGAEGSSGGHGTHSSMQPIGNLRIEANLAKSLPQATTVVMYALFEGSVMEIDKHRNVFIAW